MSVQVEKLEKNMAKLTVEVPAEDVEKAIQGAYQKMKKSINIPGFRKGKSTETADRENVRKRSILQRGSRCNASEGIF